MYFLTQSDMTPHILPKNQHWIVRTSTRKSGSSSLDSLEYYSFHTLNKNNNIKERSTPCIDQLEEIDEDLLEFESENTRDIATGLVEIHADV